MRTRGAALCLMGLALAALAYAPASAEIPRSRLFVIVSPLDGPGPSTVVAFTIQPGGTPVQAESYPTGGNGDAWDSPQGVVVDPGGRFLFAANNASDSIAVFVIKSDATLEPVDGSPFPVGDAPITYAPRFLAVSPDASFLYAATSGGLMAFEVSDDGALSPIQTLQVEERGIAISWDGGHLYAAGWSTNAVDAYKVTPSGTLEEIDGSPFGYFADRPNRVVLSSDGRRLWVQDLDTGIAAFEVDGDGALSLSGQTDVGAFSSTLALADRRPGGAPGTFLYTSPPFEPEVRGFEAAGEAPAALPGSPFPAEYSAEELVVGPLVPALRLYQVTREPASILPMEIMAGGALSRFDSPVPVVTGDGSVPNGATYLVPGALYPEIDVIPGSDPNPIRLRSHGEISVAILGDDDFDVADIEQWIMRLGPAGAFPVHDLPHPLEDIDGDGDADLVLHYRTEETGIGCDDTTVDLFGLTIERRWIRASDAVEVLECGNRPHRHCESEMRRGRR